jgi:hypothetical protein
MTQDNQKKVSAKALALDIQSGALDSDLKEKYGLSDPQLQSLFKKLIDLGGITVEDLDNRGVRSNVSEGSSHISPQPVQPETKTDPKTQQTLQKVKNVLAQAYEQIPPGSDLPQQAPPPTTDETSEQITEKVQATMAEAWAKLPVAQSKLYNYFIKPLLFLCAFAVLFVLALVKPDYWWNERWRVYTLLVLFFPVAIYGAWKSEVMSRKEKAAIFGFLIVLWLIGSLFKS